MMMAPQVPVPESGVADKAFTVSDAWGRADSRKAGGGACKTLMVRMGGKWRYTLVAVVVACGCPHFISNSNELARVK